MNMEQEKQEALGFLAITFSSPRAQQMLNFAKERGLEKITVVLPNDEQHSLAAYVQHLYINADKIGSPPEYSGECRGAVNSETYQIVSMMIALEEVRTDNWGYGSRLLFDLRKAGIQLERSEVAAFLAMEGSYETNRSKGDLLDNNLLAVSMYCGRLMSLYNTLPGRSSGFISPNMDVMKQVLEARKDSAMETIEELANRYIPALIGEENRHRLTAFLNFLRKSDFYYAPASTKYHMARPMGLAEHTVNVIYDTANILLPATEAQIGEIVLAALCHDICKVNVYVPEWKKKKVYRTSGRLTDNGGSFDWDQYLGYNYNDKMPFGHGRKSLYMALGFFDTALPESVASAIDAHMHNIDDNPAVGLQMMEQPLGLWLHIGDVLATHIDEYGIGPVESVTELNQLLGYEEPEKNTDQETVSADSQGKQNEN